MSRDLPIESMNWRVNLIAAGVAQFLCIAGFMTSLSFMPFYIRELGVTDVHQVELWTGAMTSVGALSMALVSPIWGTLSDRHGRKLMVERAAFGGAAVAIAMSLTGNVQQLFVLRLLHGILAGTVPAFVTLVASFVPPSEVGFSLGLMQMAVFTGYSVGPMVGGLVADQVGYRWTFRVTAALLIAAGLLVLFLVKERFEARPSGSVNRRMTASLSTIAHSLPVMGAMVAIGVVYAGNFASRPLLPLLVEKLPGDSQMVNTAVGSVYGVYAVASATAAVLIGRISDRVGHRAVLTVCALGAALAHAGQAISPTLGSLIATNVVTGLFAGGVVPIINAFLAHNVPRDQQGAIYGVSNSVNSGGRAVGPMVGAAFATAWGIRTAFLAAGCLFALAAGWMAFVFSPRRKGQEREGVK